MRPARLEWRRPSPSLVISCIALFVALSGSAYALSRGEVKTRHLADNAVKTKKIANNAVSARKVRNNAIRTAKLRDGAVTADKLADGVGSAPGPAGGDLAGNYPNPTIGAGRVTAAKLGNGAVTASKLGEIVEVGTGLEDIPSNSSRTLSADCPPGARVITGGAGSTLSPTDSLGIVIEMSGALVKEQVGRTVDGWTARFRNTTTDGFSALVWAFCLA